MSQSLITSSKKLQVVDLKKVAIHPVLKEAMDAVSNGHQSVLSHQMLTLATKIALETQVFSTICSENEILLTGSLIGCIALEQGNATVSVVNCQVDYISDPDLIAQRAWHEALLILGTWPGRGQAEIQASQIIGCLPDALRNKAFGLRGRSTTELAAMLNSSRYKLKLPRRIPSDETDAPLGFSLAVLKTRIGQLK